MSKHTLSHSIRKIDGEYRITFRVDGKLYESWTIFDDDKASALSTARATIEWFNTHDADPTQTFDAKSGHFIPYASSAAITIASLIKSALAKPVDVRPRLCIRADCFKPLDHPDNWEAGRVYTADELEENRRAGQAEAAALMEDAAAFGFYGPFEGARA